MIKKGILIIAIGYFAFLADKYIVLYWSLVILEGVTYHRYFGFIETLYLIDWIPSIILYSLIGFIYSKYQKTININWILLLMLVVLIFEISFVRHGFSENADFINIFWARTGYIIPSMSLLLGYGILWWLTRHSSRPLTRPAEF